MFITVPAHVSVESHNLGHITYRNRSIAEPAQPSPARMPGGGVAAADAGAGSVATAGPGGPSGGAATPGDETVANPGDEAGDPLIGQPTVIRN